MTCNMKFRLGLLDGIEDRQTGKSRDLAKLERVKGPDYFNGYRRGIESRPDQINKTEKETRNEKSN